MAIKSNQSTDEVVGGGIKLYSGLSNFNVIAVNPTLDELHDLGIMLKSEPNYYVEFSGEEYFKLTFWIKNEDLTTRFEILMNNKPRVSQSGKHQYLNNAGQSTWSNDAPTYDWWKTEGTRHAFTGEETLVNFVKAWANVANGDDVYFESIDKIVRGDVAEVKALVKVLASNQVRLLIGVKDGKYQSVYTKVFGRIKPQRDDVFVKNLNDDYGAFNAEFDTTLAWGPFSPQLALVTPDAEDDSPAESDDWV
mgnify:FL=1|jgi:hypothetical protein|tara:strand:+ start:14733 stop:15482 length:750 start_codon:yes stop_codon:yes gene_type:complete